MWPSPNVIEYTDHTNAAPTPNEIRVSIVAVACRRFVHAALWNGHAAQATTGVVRASATHCQPGNWIGITIDSTVTGTARTSDTMSRNHSSPDASESEAASGSLAE